MEIFRISNCIFILLCVGESSYNPEQNIKYNPSTMAANITFENLIMFNFVVTTLIHDNV